MIEEPKVIESWSVNRKERKALNKKENEKFKKVFDDGTNDCFVFKYINRKSMIFKGNIVRITMNI